MVYLLVWHPPPLHTPYKFLHQSLSSFRSTCPYHHNLFCCYIKTMPSNPTLFQLFTWNSMFYLNLTHPSDHSHLCPLKCPIFFFSYRPGLTSVQYTTSCRTAVQSQKQNLSHGVVLEFENGSDLQMNLQARKYPKLIWQILR